MAVDVDALLERFETRLGRTLDDPERSKALEYIEDAVGECEHIVVAALPNPLPRVVSKVILTAARRVFDNPTAKQSENLGQYSSSNSETSVYLTDQEKDIVRRACIARGVSTSPSRVLKPYLGTTSLYARSCDSEFPSVNEFGQHY